MIEADPGIGTATIWQHLAEDHGATVASHVSGTTSSAAGPTCCPCPAGQIKWQNQVRNHYRANFDGERQPAVCHLKGRPGQSHPGGPESLSQDTPMSCS